MAKTLVLPFGTSLIRKTSAFKSVKSFASINIWTSGNDSEDVDDVADNEGERESD